jgi:sulfite dehydrogenase (quinone) subunit SoeC
MHPALSVIFFTTASGAGYGLLAMLGLGFFFDLIPGETSFGLSTIVIALLLITTGLLSSTLHLGHPERAWRALSQWRSSWLSREGVLAVATYIPILVFAYGLLFLESINSFYALAALVMSLLCLITVYSTSMIYASLKTVHAWANRLVPIAYLSLALMTGLLLLNTLTHIYAESIPVISYACLIIIVVAFTIKLIYWRYIIRTTSASTAESATGLGHLGKVKLVQSPHTQDNYLLKEMGFQIARKHADKLRSISLLCGFIIPFILTFFSLGSVSFLAIASSILAVIFSLFGVIVERWLFFAEAKHTVMLYYGNPSA